MTKLECYAHDLAKISQLSAKSRLLLIISLREICESAIEFDLHDLQLLIQYRV